LDAVGKTISKIGNVQKHTAEDERAEHVMLVITTDGMENASREFNYEKVRQMIEHQKSKYRLKYLSSLASALNGLKRFVDLVGIFLVELPANQIDCHINDKDRKSEKGRAGRIVEYPSPKSESYQHRF